LLACRFWINAQQPEGLREEIEFALARRLPMSISLG
jgi:hypothetical protein